jgi:hypothetical protein
MGKITEALQKEIDNKKSMEEIYIDGRHEYDYCFNNDDVSTYTLYYSHSDYWSDHIKGTEALTLEDTGNGVKIIGLNSKKEIDYSKIEELHILLRLYTQVIHYEIAQPAAKTFF